MQPKPETVNWVNIFDVLQKRPRQAVGASSIQYQRQLLLTASEV